MNQHNNTTWVSKYFSDLSATEVYEMLRLRSSVFVIEQQCLFLDADNYDQKAYHVLGYIDGELIATTRLFDKDIVYKGYQSIGRVANATKYRSMGIGKKLMQYSIAQCEILFGKGPIKIGAQLYLKKFYSEQGFEQAGEIYLEDEIDHIPMIRC